MQACDHAPDTVVRVALQSFGSALWPTLAAPANSAAMFRFLIALRALLRPRNAVCLLTIPTHLQVATAPMSVSPFLSYAHVPSTLQDEGLALRLLRRCDCGLALHAFTGTDAENNPALKEYHGLLHLRKLPRLDVLSGPTPDTADIAFKLKRQAFVVEKLHLPPELGEAVSRTVPAAAVPEF